MNQYIMTEEQRNLIVSALSEVPAKISFMPILTLKQLPLYVEKLEIPVEESAAES